MQTARLRTEVVALVALAAVMGLTWSLTASGAGRLQESGASGLLRTAVAFAIGALWPRWWTPAVALVVPLASRDRDAGTLLAVGVIAALIATGVLARRIVARLVARPEVARSESSQPTEEQS